MAAMALLLPAAAAALAAVHLPQHPLPPIPSSPSCMLNGEPCPLPQWEPDWSTINSTALMSTDPAGFAPKHRWGWVTLDWQCGVKTWLGTTPKQCTCEATSAAACAALKAAGKVKRCSIYHNMELSLEWIESERAVMDAAHVEAGWFLRFPNGSAFSHPRFYRPGVGPLLQQWFIDWRSAAATEYFVSAIVNSTLADGVDGTFTDDRTGVPAEHPEVGPTLNLTELELQDIQHATQAAGQKLASALAAANRTCWDCVGGAEGAPGSNWGRNQRPAPKGRAACAAHMRKLCAPQMQERGMFMSWDTGWNESECGHHPLAAATAAACCCCCCCCCRRFCSSTCRAAHIHPHLHHTCSAPQYPSPPCDVCVCLWLSESGQHQRDPLPQSDPRLLPHH
jgi:hypothetical protein